MSLPSFDHALDLFFGWTCQTTLSATVLIAIVMLVQLLFRRVLPARWQYAMGLLVLLRLVLPYAPVSSLSVFNLTNRFASLSLALTAPDSLGTTTSSAPVSGTIVEAPRSAVAPAASSATSQAPPASRPEILAPAHRSATKAITLHSVAKYLWLVGCLAMFAIIICRHRKFAEQLRRWEPVREPRVLELLNECQAMLGVKRNITILAADSLNTPALFGIFQPRLLLPTDMLRKLDDRELRHIFLHELVHLQRGDVPINYGMLLLRSLHWFNPFVWLALRRLRADQELACDAAVLSCLAADEQLRYGGTLIKLLADFPAPDAASCPGAVPFITNKQAIKRRIQMIANFKPSGRLTLIASLALIAALAWATFTRAADNSGFTAPPPAAQSAEESPIATTGSESTGETGSSPHASASALTVIVATDRTASLSGHPGSLDREQLKETLRAEVENNPQVRLDIQGATTTRFADLAWVVGLANQLKITNVTLHAAVTNGRNAGDTQMQDLQQQLADLAIKIAAQEKALAQSAGYPARDSSGSPSPPGELPPQANPAVLQTRKELLEKETLLNQLNRLSSAELRQVLPTTVPDALLTQSLQDLNAAQAKYAALRANVGVNNPEAVSTAALVANLNAQVDDRVKGILRGLKTQIDTDREVIDTLNRQSADAAQRTQYNQYIQAKAELEQLKAAREQVLAKLAAYQQTRADDQNETGLASAVESHDAARQPPANASSKVLDALKQQIARLDEEIRASEANYNQAKSELGQLEQSKDAEESKLHIAVEALIQARIDYPSGSPILEAAQKRVDEIRRRLAAEEPTSGAQLQLTSQILELKADAAEIETTLENLKKLAPEELSEVLPTITPDSILVGLINDLAAAKSKLAELSANFGTNYPDVKTAQHLIADKNAQVASRVKGILIGLQTKLDAAKALIKQREDDLKAVQARDHDKTEQMAAYYRAQDQLAQLQRIRKVLANRLEQEATNSGVLIAVPPH